MKKFILFSTLISFIFFFNTPFVKADEETFLDLSLEELLNISVSSVSKTKSGSLFDTPAAVYVVTQEDIRRSGTTNIQDALRMVPGLYMQQLNANSWATGIRGFPKLYSTRLLVLIDGRSLYQSYTAGVYWADVDYPLNDIERIEVIRGPGGTTWGSNAADGIINIVTKHARDTTGTSLSFSTGTELFYQVRARQGFEFGSGDTYLRFFGKAESRDRQVVNVTSPFSADVITDPNDQWTNYQFGARFDKEFDSGLKWMMTSDLRRSKINDVLFPLTFPAAPFFSIQNHQAESIRVHFLNRLTYEFDNGASFWFQNYYDFWDYDANELIENAKFHTLDFDSQISFPLFGRQTLSLGAGYRLYFDRTTGVGSQQLDPLNKTLHLGSAFIEDEIELWKDHLWLTLGSKFESQTYTNFEWQPSAKLRLSVNDDLMFWASFTKAVRLPSRAEAEFDQFPVGVILSGGVLTQIFVNGIDPAVTENSYHYEAGFRAKLSDRVSIDVAGFYNDYKDLQMFCRGTPDTTVFPQVIISSSCANLVGRGIGVEFDATVNLTDWWRIKGNYTLVDVDVSEKVVTGSTAPANNMQHPQHKVDVRSYMSLSDKFEFDVALRLTSALAEPNFSETIGSYFVVDSRLAFKPNDWLTTSVVVMNLFDSSHYEAPTQGTRPTASEVQTSLYGKIDISF